MEDQGQVSPGVKADSRYQRLRTSLVDSWKNKFMQTSRTQLDVLAAVRRLPGCSGATSEQLTDDGLFSIDIALELPDGLKVAIEVDGPWHFMTNDPMIMDGATVLRNRMLASRGWKVVSVPVQPWDLAFEKGKAPAESYLRKLLEQNAVNIPG